MCSGEASFLEITQVRNKNSNIRFSIPKGTALKGKNSLPVGANSFL